jgi:replicative DNA helicase
MVRPRRIQQALRQASGDPDGGFSPFGHSLAGALKAAEAAHQRDGQWAGLATGLPSIDRLLGGLHRSDLVVLASRPSMGKTALGTNIAFHAAHAHRAEPDGEGRPRTVDGAVVGFFSLEMSTEQLATRILAEQAGVPSERIRRGELRPDEFDRVRAVAAQFMQIPLHIDDTPALTVAGLRMRARRLKRTHGLGLLVVDYLQLVDAQHRKDGRVQEVSEITRGLKTLAKDGQRADGLPLKFWNELNTVTPPDRLVRRLLGTSTLALLYGEPGCGKTFLATDLAMHIALGWQWFGRAVTPGAVIYVACEGATRPAGAP